MALRSWLLLSLLLLGSCSSTTFLYNRLDFLIPWYAGGYVDLDRQQSDRLDELLVPLLDWHRRTELPRYVELLDDIIRSLDEPVTVEAINGFSRRVEAAWFRLEGEAVERMLALGAELDDSQIQEFLDRLQKDQEKYESKYLKRDEEDYAEDAYDGLLDNAQDYLGRLNREQKKLTAEAAADMLRTDRAWLSERADWIGRLSQLLQREPGWQQAVRDSLAARDDTVAPEYTETVAHNTAVIQQWLATLLNSRTDQQDERLRKRLGSLRDDLQTLSDEMD